MTRLSLIRIATYALFILCLLFANRWHFIPLKLPTAGIDVPWWVDLDTSYRGGVTPTLLPGFADTRLAGVDIVRLATECVKKEKIDQTKLSWLKITLATLDKRLVWVVTWDILSDPAPFPTDFRVIIDDASGHASFERLSHP